ncbi:MAG: adenosylmethionine-8-amino-7-oxononanoate aminotransferase [Mariprofundus sp.]|nr:adenosylmethionine-8-amino-7-oxononanoate aminotransferase [Mariprofundus sp.]
MKTFSAHWRRLRWSLWVLLMLSSCGYHLVGQGGASAIPAEVHSLSIVGNADASLVALLRPRLTSTDYQLLNEADSVLDLHHHALLHLQMSGLDFRPSAYDLSGIASQYRMVVAGRLMLEMDGKTLWQSGSLQRQGDIYVTGGPASIEASRSRLLRDLQKQWVSDAIGRLRSGF